MKCFLCGQVSCFVCEVHVYLRLVRHLKDGIKFQTLKSLYRPQHEVESKQPD